MDVREMARGLDRLEFCVGEGWDAWKNRLGIVSEGSFEKNISAE